MKQQLLIALALLLLPWSAWSAAYVGSVSGNWSNSATWGGAGVPGTGDTVTINNGVTVTQDGDVTVGATVVEGRLTQASNVTLTIEGALAVGNGSGKNGQFDFGPGATLALGTNNLVLNNCTLTSAATSVSWAKVTGSGNIAKGTVYTAPGQSIAISYVSFQNTGQVAFAVGAHGTVYSSFSFANNVIHGPSAFKVGVGGYGSTSTVYNVSNNDFRNVSTLNFFGSTGVYITRPQFTFNTFSNETVPDFRFNQIKGWNISGNVFHNTVLDQGGQVSTSGALEFAENFFYSNIDDRVASFPIGLEAPTVERNYVYIDYANAHFIGSAGSGGSGTYTIKDNVFESDFNIDGSNAIIIAPVQQLITGNILIGAGNIAVSTTAVTTPGLTIENNTSVITSNAAWAYGYVYGLETSGAVTGDVYIRSNMTAYRGGVTQAASDRANADISSKQPGAVTYADYNNWFDMEVNYHQLTLGNTPTNDIAVDPQFVDDTRGLANWNGNSTVLDSVNDLLAMNGYDAVSKTQASAPSGVTPADLLDWVRAGYAPTNAALATAGYGGTYIGAVEPVAAATTGAALLMGW